MTVTYVPADVTIEVGKVLSAVGIFVNYHNHPCVNDVHLIKSFCSDSNKLSTGLADGTMIASMGDDHIVSYEGHVNNNILTVTRLLTGTLSVYKKNCHRSELIELYYNIFICFLLHRPSNRRTICEMVWWS